MSMYNQPIKEEYINYYMSISQTNNVHLQRQQFENFFSRLGVVEKSFNVDIADADYETLIMILNQIGKGGLYNDEKTLWICKQYVEWSIKNGHTRNFENKLDGVTIKNLDKSAIYRMTMVKDEQEFIDYLDVCFNDVNSDSIDIVFRLYAVLIFNGVEPTMIHHLLSGCINLSTKTISIDNKTINLSDVACEYFRIFNDLQVFVVPRGNLSPRNIAKADTGHLLETSSQDRRSMPAYFRSALSNASKKYYNATHIKKSLNSSCIYKSGVFYRAWAKESSSGILSLDEYFQFKKLSVDANKNKLLFEYAHWKKAFNL